MNNEVNVLHPEKMADVVSFFNEHSLCLHTNVSFDLEHFFTMRVTCSKCGFIRLYDMEIILKKLKEEGK